MRKFYCILILVMALLAIPFLTAQADHSRFHNEITIHKMNEFWNRADDIYVMTIYINSPSDIRCKSGFAIDDKGACTSINYHYDVYVLYLMETLPEKCGEIFCIKEKGVYLLMGQDNHLWEIIQILSDEEKDRDL